MTTTNNEDYNIELIPPPPKLDNIKADLNFKLIVIGNPNCGKDFIRKEFYFEKEFDYDSIPFFAKINDKILVRLQIWDTCGEGEPRTLLQNFFGDTSLVILVYSINDLKSFYNLGTWIKQLRTYINKSVRIFLIGNNADLEKNRIITEEEGKKFQLEYDLDFFIEISQKTKAAKNILLEAVKLLYGDYLKKLNILYPLYKYLNF